MSQNYKIKDISLAELGRKKINWAESRMPVLLKLRKKFSETRPLQGMRISGCLHVTKETATLIETLVVAGADVAWCGCNPLSTNDEIAAALAANNIKIWAWNGMSTQEYYWAIDQVLKFKPTLTLDDGGDLIFRITDKYPELADKILGGTEETTTGVHRLRGMEQDKKLLYPIIAVNDSVIKSHFDNYYGTGQSSLDGILRATSILFAGKIVVVAGYGWCGAGLAIRAKGMGANVIVTEVNYVAALKAAMDGNRVMSMNEAAKVGDVFITVTGMKDVITVEHIKEMKDGAILANSGHYDVEIQIDKLKELAKSVITIRPHNQKIVMPSGKTVFLIGNGRLVNLAAAEGHPSEVMDLSFAGQLFALKFLAEQKFGTEKKVFVLPNTVDQELAQIKLESMGCFIDKLTVSQISYLGSYKEGT